MRYVVAVAREKNFTRAARSCFVAQSALSHQIKALENELGVALFARTSRRVELTASGEAFLPHAHAALEAADQAVSHAAAAVGRVRGPLRVGMIPTLTAVDVADFLTRFRAAHPQVRVGLQVGGSHELEADVTAGRLDMAFLGLPTGRVPEIGHRLLDRHRLLAVLPAGHHLGEREELRLSDLVTEPFADFPAGSPGRAQSDLAFEQSGLSRDVTIEAMDVSLILNLVERGLAVALLAPGVVPAGRPIVVRPVLDGPERAEHLVWNQFNPTPAASAALEVLELSQP